MSASKATALDHGFALEEAVRACDFPPHNRIIVAVSGGPDSVALLSALMRVIHASGVTWSILAVHVNHQLRGEESVLDEEFVERLCVRLGVEYTAVRVDTRSFSAEHHLSIETGARELRYAALERTRVSWRADRILTAHTANDQAETLLMRLLRGTGLSGLAGIPPRRGCIERPFLRVRHEQVMGALQNWGIGYRLDSSNQDERHRRNRIRRVVLPGLEREAHDLVATLGRTANVLRGDADYLRAETSVAVDALGVHEIPGGVGGSAHVWRTLHVSLQRSTLRYVLARYFAMTDPDFQTVDRLGSGIARTDRKLALPGGLLLTNSSDQFQLTRGPATPPAAPIPTRLTVPGSTAFGAAELSAAYIRPSADEFARLVTVCDRYHALCAPESVGGSLLIRSRKPGDRIRPLGAGGSRKLQDIMVDQRVSEPLRAHVPVLENDRHLVWLAGMVLDDRAAARGAGDGVILLSYRPLTQPIA